MLAPCQRWCGRRHAAGNSSGGQCWSPPQARSSCRGDGAPASAAAAAQRQRQHQHQARHGRPAAASAAQRPQHQQQQQQQQEQQHVLTPANMQQYVEQVPHLAELLGGAGCQAEQLLDGVINAVFLVRGASGERAIVKQALPYVRAVGESFPLDRKRMEVEAAAMQLLDSCCPAHIPQLYDFNPQQSILAMQCVPPPHQKLLYCIRQGQILTGLETQLAELMAAYLAHTSLQLKPPDEQQAMLAQFANIDIVQANERVVLISPFTPADSTNRWSSPHLDDDVQAMWSDTAVMASAAAMLQLYRQQKEALIHNDLHAGNLLTAPGSLFLIDWEFATVGPLAFDVGCLLGNLMLAVLSLKGMQETEQQQQQPPQQQQHTRREQAEWLFEVMHGAWTKFVQQYQSNLAAAGQHGGLAEDWQQRLLADSCGFAGCCLIRLTVGIHHYPDIQSIADTSTRAAVERACLRLGQQLLLLRAAHAAGSGSDAPLTIQLVQQLVRDACSPWLS